MTTVVKIQLHRKSIRSKSTPLIELATQCYKSKENPVNRKS